MSLKNEGNLNFEGYSVDRGRWQLHWHGEPIALSRKTFDLLLYLVDHRDQVASKDELLKSLWPKQVVEEGNLNQQIFLLRKALSRHGPGKIIETVTGRGYRFTAKLESPAALETDGSTVVIHDRRSVTTVTVDESVEDDPNDATSPRTNRASSAILWTAVGVLACVLAALGIYTWHFWQNRSTGAPVDVVLTDFGGTGDPMLDRALNDALRTDLSQSPFLTVVSSSQVRATLIEMKQAENTPLNVALAREVCERNSAQVLLQGTVSRFGQRYLVALLAGNCATESNATSSEIHGELLAQAKEEVARLDDLPRALDVLVAEIRKALGESRASIRRFDKPLRQVSTGSLVALKAYSEGYRLGLRGDWLGSLPLLQRAIELDPQFALAYFDMAALYSNLNDTQNERAALIKAYELRDTVTEPEQFLITALYHDVVTGDAARSIETYKTWTALYPRAPQAFANLAEEYDSIGQAALGVDPARHAVELRPADSDTYVDLALTQLHSGQTKPAQQTCELAINKNFGTVDIRHLLLQALYAQNDAAGVAVQLDWGRSHPDALRLHVDEIFIALSKGEVRDAQSLLTKLSQTHYPSGLAAEYQFSVASIARMLAEVGLTTESAALLKPLSASLQDKNALVALAENGAVAQADEGLQKQVRDHGHETLWKGERIPETRAALFLAEHKPEQVASALEPALPFDGLTFGPAFLRGQAYLDLGKPDLALNEFRKITEHAYIDPLSNEYPLAILASARAYVRENEPDKARQEFERFFSLWKTADTDLPLLRTAQAEYDSLPSRLR
jgi:eukaryotic-like serine/threonine-protein kinase